ncbi:DNA repair protein RecO [Desulfovibrio sp. OttesenSCG-928-G15]|nr:DNA repair protein RecO [Desulfovibrio sp. OttesenSCG-928-G15]
MEFTERVIILQVGKFKEADLWVRFLSPSRGMVSAFAFGGSRSRRRFMGCLDVFNEISVRVATSSRSSYLALQEGVLIKGLERLRSDWSRFGMAVNCARFLQSFGIGPEGANTALELMRELLFLLEHAEVVPALLPVFFRIRLAYDHGYALQSNSCSFCGKVLKTPENSAARLVLQEGRIACVACAGKRGGPQLPLCTGALEILEYITQYGPSMWTVLPERNSQASRELSRAVDGFIQYHVGIIWDKGRFVRQ